MNLLKSTFYSLAILGIAALSQSAYSQNETSNQLKVYSNFNWHSSERIVGFLNPSNIEIVEKVSSKELGYFSPAFAFATPKGNFHEIELSRLKINQTDEIRIIDPSTEFPQISAGERKTNILIALKYEYNLFFFKKKEDKKMKASMGFAASPFYSNSTFRPWLSNQFSSSVSDVGVLFSITPHLNYNLGKRWFLDLNVPINFAQLQLETRRVDDPAIEPNQRTVTTLDANVFPSNYLVRFGVGLRL